MFNNAGQHWNHIVFWQCMSPKGGSIPSALEKKINEDLGGVAKFKDEFKAAGVSQFGSGWAWLVLGSDGKLKVTKTPNGSNPLATGEGKVLLGCDVWEHAITWTSAMSGRTTCRTGSTRSPTMSMPKRN